MLRLCPDGIVPSAAAGGFTYTNLPLFSYLSISGMPSVPIQYLRYSHLDAPSMFLRVALNTILHYLCQVWKCPYYLLSLDHSSFRPFSINPLAAILDELYEGAFQD